MEDNTWLISSGIASLLCLLFWSGTIVTYKIGYELPNTNFGQASLEVYDSVLILVGIPSFITSTLDDATQQVVQEICNNYDKESCRYARMTVATYEDATKIKDLLDKGKTIKEIAEDITS